MKAFLKCIIFSNFLFIVSLLSIFNIEIGPSDNFTALRVQINTWPKYISLISFIAMIKIMNVLNHEFIMSVISFSIYNPIPTYEMNGRDLKIASILINSSSRFLTIFIISRLDVALFSYIFEQIVHSWILYDLIN